MSAIMLGCRAGSVLAAAALLWMHAATAAAEPPMVTAVELSSAYPLPEQQVRAAIGDLAGKPLMRDAVRASLERLWASRRFSTIRVEEIPGAAGVTLRYELTQRPLVRRIEWRGRSGIDLGEAVTTAGLGIGEEASPERLARAERDLLTRYRREGYLAARVRFETTPVPGSSEQDVAVVLESGERARIGVVRFVGDTGPPAEQVRKTLALKAGALYRESLVLDRARAAEERIRRDGYYGARVTARPDWRADVNHVDIEIDVTAGTRFRIEFEGRSALSESTLRSRLTFVDGGSTDAFEQEASAHQMEAAYRERGYHFVTVTPQPGGDADGDVLRFVIDEGPRVTVESVTFSGTHTVPDEQLAKRIETAPARLARRGLFRQATLDRDVGVLLAYLRSLGHPDAAVGPPEVRFSEDRTRAEVVIPVVDGARLSVGAISVAGARILPRAEIEAALPFKPGVAWDTRQPDDGQRAIEQLYAGRGYHRARVRVDTSPRDATVDLHYHIDEGEQTRIGRVLLRGLVAARESIVRRALPFEPGDVLIPDRLILGQRRLAEFAAFDSVSVDPLRPPPEPFADVDVSLRERKPWHLDFGVGYSDADGGRAFIEVGHDNLFGTGTSLSIRQRVSAGGNVTSLAQRTDILGRVPFVFGTPWWLDVDIFQQMRKELGYDLQQYGIWLDAHRELFADRIRGLRGNLRYRIESSRYSDVDPTLLTVDVEPGHQFIISVTPMLTLDRRDEPLDPTRGSFHQVSVETGARVLGSEVQFVKGLLETRWFFDWVPKTVIATAGRLGLAAPYGGTTALAIQDRFFAGGATTIRGYREDRVGPLDARRNPAGGNATAILNLEWRFPIYRWLAGAVFVDSGTVTPEISDLRLSAFRTGTGGGLRIKTPVGPIRFDVGYALYSIPDESRTQFHITFGNPF
jgi:outer membrane protein insertion porin family